MWRWWLRQCQCGSASTFAVHDSRLSKHRQNNSDDDGDSSIKHQQHISTNRWWCNTGVTVIYVGLFGRTKKSCDKNLIAPRIIKFCAKLNSKRQASYKSLQAYWTRSFSPRQHRVLLQNVSHAVFLYFCMCVCVIHLCILSFGKRVASLNCACMWSP